MEASHQSNESGQNTLPQGWSLKANGHLYRAIKCNNFLKALDLANRIAPIAEAAQHHPDLEVRWGHLGIELFTHDANAVTQKDFDLALKINALLK